MMDRIGTLNYSSVLLNDYQRIQGRVVQTQTQISSGKVGDRYTDVEDKAGVLAAAKSRMVRVDALSTTAKEVESRLSLQDVQLVQFGEIADSYREAIANAVATGRGEALMETAKGLFQTAASLLNSKVDGVYIYGGTRSDVQPVSVTTLDALEQQLDPADVFQNSRLPQSQLVEDGVVVETGQLASDLANDLFQMMYDLAKLDTGANGPIGSQLTDAQKSFLQGQMAAIPQVSRDIVAAAAVNGARYQQVQDVIARHEDMSVELKKFIGDIEDVDMAEAITRLNQDQASQQAAARMISQMQEISLLNYLR